MTTLDQIKQALFTATNITDALAKLDALGVPYRECAVCDETYHLLQEDATFWAPRSKHVTTIHVCIGDVIATLDYRQQFFAQQQPDLSQSVPAHDSPVAVEQPILACPQCGSIHFTTEKTNFVEPEFKEKDYFSICEICEFEWFSNIRVEYSHKKAVNA